jgi:hypothetical protein
MRWVRDWMLLLMTGAISSALLLATSSAQRTPREDRARFSIIEPQEAEKLPDFRYQGEYVGAVHTDEGQRPYGVQIIALGDGEFEGVGYPGGLPGDGWNEGQKRYGKGELKDEKVTFVSDGIRAELDGTGHLVVYSDAGRKIGEFKKIERRSPTLGQKPPAGAVVLFDGRSPTQFLMGRMTKDGLLMEGCTSKQEFNSCGVHVEFLLPFMPYARGQARGNSGIYVQGRYEVQVLDSFGLEGTIDECGAIYGVKPPDVNMCFPPLTWQTYDIEFHAARYDASGKKVANARMSVWHNGVLVHKDVEVPRATRGAIREEGPTPGPLYLQDHGCPVRYRNIWVEPLID